MVTLEHQPDAFQRGGNYDVEQAVGVSSDRLPGLRGSRNPLWEGGNVTKVKVDKEKDKLFEQTFYNPDDYSELGQLIPGQRDEEE